MRSTRARVAVVALTALLSFVATPVALAQPEPPPPQQPVDPPEVDQAFQRGMQAFTAHDYATAATAFEIVSTRSQDPGRRAAATELLAQSRRLSTQGDGGELPPPPPAYGDTQAPLPPGVGVPAAPIVEDTGPNQEGRVAFLGFGLWYGLTFYSWALPLTFDLDTRAGVGLGLVMGAASFFGPFVLTMNSEVTWGQASQYWYGSQSGIIHGMLAYGLYVGDLGSSDDEFRALLGTMLLTSLIEGYGGYFLAGNGRLNEGHAAAISAGGFFGLGWLTGIGVLALGDTDDYDDGTARALFGLALLGSIGGSIAGKFYADARHLSWGDATVVQWGGIVGAYAAAVPLVLGEAEEARVIAPIMILGSLAGIFVGDRLVLDRDYNAGQGFLVMGGTIAGGAFGAGLGFAFTTESGSDDDDLKIMLTAGVIGAGAGFALTALLAEPTAEGPAVDGPRLSLAPWIDTSESATRGVVVNGQF